MSGLKQSCKMTIKDFVTKVKANKTENTVISFNESGTCMFWYEKRKLIASYNFEEQRYYQEF